MNLSQYFKYDSKSENAPEIKVKKRVLKSLYKGVKIPWLLVILGGLMAVSNGYVIMTQYENYEKVFNGTLTDLTPLWMYLAASFVQFVMVFACVMSDIAYVRIVSGVRKKVWRKMIRLPLKYYENETPSGMLSRMTSDAEYASKPFIATVAILQLLFYILSMIAAVPKDIPQALKYLFILLPFSIVCVIFSVRVCSRSTTFLQRRISAQTEYYNEQFGDFKFIKASRAENKAVEESLNLIERRYKAGLYNAFSQGLQELANDSVSIIILCCVFLGGIGAIRAGTISDTTPISGLYAFAAAFEITMMAAMVLPSYFASTIGGSKKMVSIFTQPEENTAQGAELSSETGDLCTEGLNFSYDDRQILNDVNVTIPQGKVTALVGPNGSGKTTLVRVLQRLYPYESGNLSFNGENAENISLQSWRKMFAVVSQKPAMFSGSIRENICYGIEREVSEEELLNVVHLADLDKVVASYDDGLDHQVGSRGSNLSGGEQQRIAIARAMLKDAKILILDEATASLDTSTEGRVKDGLAALIEGRTVIEIAHRRSAALGADHVIALDDGRVVASGRN